MIQLLKVKKYFKKNNNSNSVPSQTIRPRVSYFRLTSFVLICFHQADQFVPVDNGIFAAGLKWLLQQQNTDGSFAENMRVIHYQMQVHVYACLH